MPAKQKRRTVIIKQQARSSMTSDSGTHPFHHVANDDVGGSGGRTAMGWTSTPTHVELDLFESIEDAKFFCDKPA